jgi:hypothetical protein
LSINREGGFGDTEPMPQTDKFPCVECGAVFLSRQDLEHHKDMGHYVGKPQFFLRNRELLEQIEFVHEVFPVSDWKIVNAGSISLNGKLVTERELFERLANSKNSFLDIVLTNASFDQTMHYKIDIKIADISEVDEVTRIFRETFLAKDSAEDLSTSSFTNFFARCSHLVSAEKYASGLHSFLIAHLDKLQKNS